MNTVPPTPTQKAEARTARHLEILDECIELGIELARKLQTRALEAADVILPGNSAITADTTHLAIAFDHTTRAVRRAVLLARHLQTQAPAHPAREAAAARKRIIREVEDAIDAPETTAAENTPTSGTATPSPDRIALRRELHERLDTLDFAFDLATTPVETLITHIRRDLGLAETATHNHTRRTPEDLAALHARALAPIGGDHDGDDETGNVAPGSRPPATPRAAPRHPTRPPPAPTGDPRPPHEDPPEERRPFLHDLIEREARGEPIFPTP